MVHPTTLKRSAWPNEVYSNLDKLSRAEGSPSITIAAGAIANALGCTDRQIRSTLKELQTHNYIHIDYNFAPNGTTLPSTYTLLPLEKERLAKLDEFARLLSLSRGEAMRAIARLRKTPYDPATVTLDHIAEIAGYTGKPEALAAALYRAHLVGGDGLVGW